MLKRKIDIDKLRVASPCPAAWENMSGDEKSRFCRLCSLNVYNISGMTSGEVQNLIKKTEGGICGRIYKRADGTVITKDCPVGLRAFYKRTARFAGAALGMVVALFSIGSGQKKSKKDKVCKVTSQAQVLRAENQSESVVKGVIKDPYGAVIPNATVFLTNEETGQTARATTDADGFYQFVSIAPGNYTHKVESTGFKFHEITNLAINKNESLQVNVELHLNEGAIEVTMGILAGETQIDITTSDNTFRITRELFDRLPH